MSTLQLQRKNTYCIIVALGDAYNAGILHRDFSPGNVIILDDGSGRLIDWDLSKPVQQKDTGPRCQTRTVNISALCHVLIEISGGIGHLAIHVR